MELAGHEVRLVASNAPNPKITFPEDIRTAAALARGTDSFNRSNCSGCETEHEVWHLFDKGRDRAFALPLPPNRTGGFPASGFPVDG